MKVQTYDSVHSNVQGICDNERPLKPHAKTQQMKKSTPDSKLRCLYSQKQLRKIRLLSDDGKKQIKSLKVYHYDNSYIQSLMLHHSQRLQIYLSASLYVVVVYWCRDSIETESKKETQKLVSSDEQKCFSIV